MSTQKNGKPTSKQQNLQTYLQIETGIYRYKDGKPAKVALTAVMRKLIVLMNHILKIPTLHSKIKYRC